MEIVLRPATLKNAAGIAKVHVETWQFAYSGHMPDSYLDSLSVKKRTEFWKNVLSHPDDKNNAQTFVALIEDTVVGFCSVSHCRDDDMPSNTGEVWAIYVDNEYMNKGVGTALQQKGLNYLKEQGYTTAILWVLTSNQKTRRWYESKGWKVEGKVKTEQMHGIDIEETRYFITL